MSFSSSTINSSSSKTGSSIQSGSTYKEKQNDLNKENEVSLIDVECNIQVQRITQVLEEMIYKIKLAICLPDLVADYKVLSNVLSTSHMEQLVSIFDEYDKPLCSETVLNVDTMKALKNGDLPLKNRLNPELGHLIHIMNYYQQLIPTVERMTDEKRFNSNNSKSLEVSMEFLRELEEFRILMIRQLEKTAPDELRNKIITRKLENSNEDLLMKIKEYTKIMTEDNEIYEEAMKQKVGIITKLEHELFMFNNESTVKIKKKILDSERQMVLAARAHKIKQDLQKEEDIAYREEYDNLLKKHLTDEKTQKTRRLKVETQLITWLKKYDEEMIDKQKELDEFSDLYEEEKKKCEELQKQLNEQDIEYIPLMAEREEEYEREMTEKMQKFLREHAARVIQHAWRQVLITRADKKKLKKLLKKIQDENEVEETRKAARVRTAAKQTVTKKKLITKEQPKIAKK